MHVVIVIVIVIVCCMCSNPSDESQLSISVEQGLPLRQDWLRFSRLRLRGDQPFEMGPLQLHVKAKAGFILHDLPPYEAFSIGGTNSVRGYSGMWAGGERRGRGRGAGEQGEEGEGGGHGLCWRGGKGYQQGCKGGGLLPRGLSGGWPRLGSWGQALSSAAPLAPTIIAMLAATQQHSNTATAMLAATQVTAALLQPSSPPSPGYCYCHPQVLLLPRRNNNPSVYHEQATATAAADLSVLTASQEQQQQRVPQTGYCYCLSVWPPTPQAPAAAIATADLLDLSLLCLWHAVWVQRCVWALDRVCCGMLCVGAEGGVGSGRHCLETSAELRWPLVSPLHGTLFFDYGSDLDSGAAVIGDPAGEWEAGPGVHVGVQSL